MYNASLMSIVSRYILSFRISIPSIILFILVSVVITLVLILYPRESLSEPLPKEDIDELFVARIIVLVLMVLMLVAGVASVTILHWIEPMRARRVNKPAR